MSPQEWVERRIERTRTGCWIWQRATDSAGYGRTTGGVAHRAVWKRLGRPIERGQILHHNCRNRACVNPDHLELLESARHHGLLHAPERRIDPQLRKASAAAYMRQWVARQKRNGRCIRCSDNAVRGLTLCQKHREAEARSKATARQRACGEQSGGGERDRVSPLTTVRWSKWRTHRPI